MTPTIAYLHTKLRIAHWCANLSYAALLGLLTLWAFTRAPGFSLLFWVIVCAPLLVVLPGMHRARHRAYSWLCFVILLYFIKAVEGSLSSVASWIDYGILLLSVIIFISAMLTSRWLQHAQAAMLVEPNSESSAEPSTEPNTKPSQQSSNQQQGNGNRKLP